MPTIPIIPDIDKLIAQHLAGTRGGRDDMKFHVTDLNACPRSVYLRMSGTKRDKPTAAKVKMFELAHKLHELTYDALDAADLLWANEIEVPMPKGWSGTADALCYDFSDFDDREDAPLITGDVKTSHPNIIRFSDSLPRGGDIIQISTYTHCWNQFSEPGQRKVRDDYGWLFYEDRGGSNPSLPKLVDLVPGWSCFKLMRELEEAVNGALHGTKPPPPLLPDALSYKNQRGPETFEVWARPDWHCRYCDYACEGRVDEDEEKGCLVYKRTKTNGVVMTSEGYAYDKDHPGAIDEFIMHGEGVAKDDA